MKSFGDEETIYDEIDVLDPNTNTYKPSELPEREDELAQLHQALRPVTMGGTPRNVLVYGPTGQGKTVGIDLKTEQLQEWADENDVPMKVVRISCEGSGGSYQVLSDMVKSLREFRLGPGEDAPTGYHRKVLFTMVIEELEKISGTIIMVLDEIDAIGDDDYVLYELSRASIDDVRLGLIGITNDLNFRQGLDEDVRSSLGNREVHFEPYDANQLRNILARRAVGGLRDTYFEEDETFESLVSDTLVDDVIPLCAAFAAQETGDARHAIELLSYACDYADDDGDGIVREEHVRRAHDFIEEQALTTGIVSAPLQRQMALLSTVAETIRGNTWNETADLYKTYESLCEVAEVDSLAYRTFDDKLGDLSGAGLLDKQKAGRGKGEGVTNQYKLKLDASSVLDRFRGSSSANVDAVVERLRGIQ